MKKCIVYYTINNTYYMCLIYSFIELPDSTDRYSASGVVLV